MLNALYLSPTVEDLAEFDLLPPGATWLAEETAQPVINFIQPADQQFNDLVLYFHQQLQTQMPYQLVIDS